MEALIKQLEFELTEQPPEPEPAPSLEMPNEYDLKVLTRQEHRRAELQRLRMGMDGCGCAECQVFYTTIDLAAFGSRVIRYGDCISIAAGNTGADLMDTSWDYWSPGGEIFFHHSYAYAVAPDLHTFQLGKREDIEATIKSGQPTGNKTVDSILRMDLEIAGGNYGREPETKRSRDIRSRPVRAFKHRTACFRPATVGKRIAVYKA